MDEMCWQLRDISLDGIHLYYVWAGYSFGVRHSNEVRLLFFFLKSLDSLLFVKQRK